MRMESIFLLVKILQRDRSEQELLSKIEVNKSQIKPKIGLQISTLNSLSSVNFSV